MSVALLIGLDRERQPELQAVTAEPQVKCLTGVERDSLEFARNRRVRPEGLAAVDDTRAEHRGAAVCPLAEVHAEPQLLRDRAAELGR